MRVYYKTQGVSEVAHRLISPGASNGGEEGRSINGRPPRFPYLAGARNKKWDTALATQAEIPP